MPRGVRRTSVGRTASIVASGTVPVPWVSTYSDSGSDTPMA